MDKIYKSQGKTFKSVASLARHLSVQPAALRMYIRRNEIKSGSFIYHNTEITIINLI